MEFFTISPAGLSDLYSRITEGQDPGPDQIDPAVKALVVAWELEISKIIHGIRNLLRSKETFDHDIIQGYILQARENAKTIRDVCKPNPHPVYRKLIKAEAILRLLIYRLNTKLTESTTP